MSNTFKMPQAVAYELEAIKFANGKQLVYTLPENLASYIKANPLYTAEALRELLNMVESYAMSTPDLGDVVLRIRAMKEQI